MSLVNIFENALREESNCYTSHISNNLLSIFKFVRDNTCLFEFHHDCFIVKDLQTHQEFL